MDAPMPTAEEQKAFNAGIAAFTRGAPKWANPYRWRVTRDMWVAGWMSEQDASRKRILAKHLKR